MSDEISELPNGISASSAEKIRSMKLFIAEMPHFLDDISDMKSTTDSGMDVELLRQGLNQAYTTLEHAIKEIQIDLNGKAKKVKFGKGTRFEGVKRDVDKAFAEMNKVLVNASDSKEIKANREKVNAIFKDINSVLSLNGDIPKQTLRISSVPMLKEAFDALNGALDKQYSKNETSTSLDKAKDEKSLTNKLLMFRVRLKGRKESVRTSERYWLNPGDVNRNKEYDEVQPRWNWWSKREDRIEDEEGAWKEIYDFEKTHRFHPDRR